jgi:hypothetical protein
VTRIAQQSSAWIFISHSHRDLEKVREIRNYLEQRGHNPLLFFLKCLDDDDARLPELIRDEIKVRNWFVLCDSPNARASKYVSNEVALVKSLAGKSRETIDLSQDIEPQLYKLDRLLKRATVFLSYTSSDNVVAKRIGDALKKHDYSVWIDTEQLSPGMDWRLEIEAAIADAVQEGFVLLLLNEESLQSQLCQRETLYILKRAAASRRSNVVPVIVSQFDRSGLPPELQDIQYFDLTTGQFEERVETLIWSLKTREME